MKFATVLLVSSANAQEEFDYGLDGAATNPVDYSGYEYGNYNYADDGGRLREKPNNVDLEALLANYGTSYNYDNTYDNNYSTDYNDILALINDAEANGSTTVSPPAGNDYYESFNYDSNYDGTSDDNSESADSADAGRPAGAEDGGVKLFENFVSNSGSDQFAQNLIDDSQTFCWTCNGSGADPLTDCADNGESLNCLGQGEQDYCQVTLRRVNGVITQINSRCAQADLCDGIENFKGDSPDWRFDQCRPNQMNGVAYATNPRNKNRESVCSICHYTSTDYGSSPSGVADDGASDAELISKLRFDSGNVYIVGATTGLTVEITSDDFDTEWGSQDNNVLGTFA
jgi:hypothetical protein